MRFLPAPASGEPEWVELRNPNNQTVDLSGWKIDDAEGGSSPFVLPSGSNISAGSVQRVNLAHSMFNNAGDNVRLLSPTAAVVEMVTYSASSVGTPLCHINHSGQAQPCDAPTQPTQVLTAPAHPSSVPRITPAPPGLQHPLSTAQPLAALSRPIAPSQPYQNAASGSRYRGLATPSVLPTAVEIATPAQSVVVPPPAERANWLLYIMFACLVAAVFLLIERIWHYWHVIPADDEDQDDEVTPHQESYL